MGNMASYTCISKHGAQYRNTYGKLIYVKYGVTVETDKMDLGAKGQLSKGWVKIDKKPKAESSDFGLGESGKSIDDMTIPELKLFAAKEGININDLTKKGDILEVIRSATEQ